MRAVDYLRNPEKTAVPAWIVVFGDEAHLRNEVLDAVVASVLGGEPDEFAVRRFQGDQAKLADVLDEVRTLPFFHSKRVVIVEVADPFITGFRKQLEVYAEKPSSNGLLILIPKSFPATTRLAKLAEQNGLVIDCKPLARGELSGWLTRLSSSKFRSKLEEDAARLLVELVGDDLGMLASEVEKLSIYVAPARIITCEDVSKLVEAGRVESIWKTLDAATMGRMDDALIHLDRLLATGEEPVKLVAGIAASLRKVYHAGWLRQQGVEAREACRLAEVPSFAIDKTIQQHGHLGRERVDKIPQILLQADRDIKGASTLSPRIILERVVLELARPRPGSRR